MLLLHKEDLIKAKMIPSNSEAMLMKEVQQSICADYRNLMKFAAVLEMTPATERIAKEITGKYCKELKSCHCELRYSCCYIVMYSIMKLKGLKKFH